MDAVQKSQETVIEAVRVWAKAVEKAVPAMPVSKELPTPGELVESSFQFAERLLTAQHEFAREVLAAAAPVLDKTKPERKKATSA